MYFNIDHKDCERTSVKKSPVTPKRANQILQQKKKKNHNRRREFRKEKIHKNFFEYSRYNPLYVYQRLYKHTYNITLWKKKEKKGISQIAARLKIDYKGDAN